ncbi:ABC transporter substrate-binding protein [Streptomyces tsukubensis]|uniref:ABC transporter substrate-binding protein n=1 Tax=Streptomyces tsukubensis TaxID=83656 RepID=UPI0036CBE043
MRNEDRELPQCSDAGHGMSTGAGADVQRRLEMLVRDFRSSHPPMPVVVLHTEDGHDTAAAAGRDGTNTTATAAGTGTDPEEQVVHLVEELYAGHDAHGSRCAVAPTVREGATEVRRAAGVVRYLGDPLRWNGRRAGYRRYSFPRVRLVGAIEDAVRELDPDWPRSPASTGFSHGLPDPAQSLLDQLARQRWRPRGSSRWSDRLHLFDMAHILPVSLVAVLGALAARADWFIALISGVGFLLLLVLLDNVLPGRAPLFLWLRRESRWFLTTTFLRAASPGRPTDVSLVRPVRSWNAIAARAHEVAEALKTGDDFQLQLYVLALCEDLRDNHRRWSWDLRGFKRPRPPVLFVPRASADNGGIELIKAVSDVRSRRSELDPLLLVASVRAADVDRLQRSSVQDAGTAPWTWYQEWGRNLRAGQSPSRALAELPWVIKVPLRAERLVVSEEARRQCVRASARPTAARLVWSVHTLVLVTALIATGVALHAGELADRYCSSSLLSANRDTVRLRAPGASEPECIGIAAGDVRFSDWLKGGEQAPGPDRLPWTLEQLEERIRKANAEVLRDNPDNYVTVVYAGPLSTSPRERTSPVKGIEELAGVHLAQAVINKRRSTGLRVLIANGGVDMRHQKAMAESIARYARRDPTLVGVIGAGRDLTTSTETAIILANAELPVVSGTNSASFLPRQRANWFSLAAPDDWQIEQLGLIARQLRTPKAPQYALVLARDTMNSDDQYTNEQAKYSNLMLRREGYQVLPERRYAVRSGRAELEAQTEEICQGSRVPSVIYFAGRVEDVGPLMSQLNTEQGCARRNISVLTGDDLSKADFTPQGGEGMPANVTLYHAGLARLAAQGATSFYQDAENHLPGPDGRRDWAGPAAAVLASGQTALAHDATRALHEAAGVGDQAQSRAATWVNLRTVVLPNMATGTIDFTGSRPRQPRSGHSIVLNRVRGGPDGTPVPRPLCARAAGDVRPLTVTECSIHR